jgi:hypothetical protein
MVTQNFKPIFNQLKSKIGATIDEKFGSQDEIREKVQQNIEITKMVVTETAKNVLEQARTNPMVTTYVLPALKSEKTDRAMDLLTEKLGKTPLMDKVQNFRQVIINQISPVEAAATADTDVETASEVEEVTEDTAKPTKPRTRKTPKA